MDNAGRKNLNLSFLLLLESIARLFLRFGRGFLEFTELAKVAFVNVASKDYAVRGRPTSVSRIAALTGLSRKEIKRLRTKIDEGSEAESETSTPIRAVMSAWRSDAEFSDAEGGPADLPIDGELRSFKSLVESAASNIPPGAMRKELQRIGAIELADDHVRLLEPEYPSAAAEQRMADELRAGPFPLMAAIAHNQLASDDARWPVETVSNKTIRPSDVSRIQGLVSNQLHSAMQNIEKLLEAYETLTAGDDQQKDAVSIAVAAGVYYAELRDS